MHLSCVTNLGIILKLRKAVHYAENAVIPISQKSKCFVYVWKNDGIKRKMEHNKNTLQKWFRFPPIICRQCYRAKK